ncbi:hypothetical protein SAY87_030468 [Trapa incisa]|uniref:TOD1/MUCI70 glycosyltransferase-like domain-containing protein n=1 Tax=Trapa incisa TaxID=236973 RepID=A0AAN7QK71_9MYRT|nr:hypothetical protein SAY87_030468 [Trapa incisa]
MRKAMVLTRPLIVQSKLLCFSLLYLFATLFLAIYTTLTTRCLFRSSPFDPIISPLFSYPSSYGPHKYALPTHRPSCSSPVFFSDYPTILREIMALCENSSFATSGAALRYMYGKGNKANNFGGDMNSPERFSYFDQENHGGIEIPCGFHKEFPISEIDKMAMEKCRGVVVVSAIFNDHDKVRQPRGMGSQTMAATCFFMFVDDTTLNEFFRHRLISIRSKEDLRIGVWRIVRVSADDLYENPAMNGVIPKYLVHRLFPNSKFSIWVDAKLQLVVDPLLLIHSLLVSEGVDMAISRHPYYIHTIEEAIATARWKKWRDVGSLRVQMETYCDHGLLPWSPNKFPYPSDVPDSALIIRKHGLRSDLFSCLVFNELNSFNPRDQLAFAFVRDSMRPRLRLNMFDVEVFEHVAMEYRHNLKQTEEKGMRRSVRPPNSSSLPVNGSYWGRCEKYLSQIWS